MRSRIQTLLLARLAIVVRCSAHGVIVLGGEALTPALLLLELHFKFLLKVFYTLECVFALVFDQGLFLLLLLFLLLGDLLLDDSACARILPSQIVLDLTDNFVGVCPFALLEAHLVLQLLDLLVCEAFGSLCKYLIVHIHGVRIEPPHLHLYKAAGDVHAAVRPKAHPISPSLRLCRLLQDCRVVLVDALDHFNFFALARPETEGQLSFIY